MANTQPPIAILGAGPGGLALARLLEVRHIAYMIFERSLSADTVTQGGTLDIHTNNGQLALRECGLFDQFHALARYDGQEFKALDKDGKVLWHKENEGQTDRPEIDRKLLRDLLLHSVPSERIRWGAKVDIVEREADGLMRVDFADGKVERGFKLVVGADGAWSKVRKLVSCAKPIYSGRTQLETTISPSNPIYSEVCPQLGLGSYMAFTAGSSVTAQRMGEGYYNVYIGMRRPENWSDEAPLDSPDIRNDLLASDFDGWLTQITDLIRFSDPGPLVARKLYTLPAESLNRKSVPGVTMVGDAAHLSLPNGEGVNWALFDSLELAQEIEKCGLDNLEKAVEQYEAKMLPRGIEHIKDGEMMASQMFGDDAPKRFVDFLISVGAVSAEQS